MNTKKTISEAVSVTDKKTHIHIQTEILLDQYIKGNVTKYSFFLKLMNCIQHADVSSSLKFLPSNIFNEFKQFLSRLTEVEDEASFGIPGSSPLTWGLQDVRNVIQWLVDNPNPELAPPVEDQAD